MKLIKLKIKNFRGYKDEVSVDIDNLTVIVGKNDIGKSTILEALDVFFNEGKGIVKLDKDDINKSSLVEGNKDIYITAVFTDLPESYSQNEKQACFDFVYQHVYDSYYGNGNDVYALAHIN